MRGQLTEKADVFSYGIVALELVSGRPNLDSHLQSHATYVLDWVSWPLSSPPFVTQFSRRCFPFDSFTPSIWYGHDEDHSMILQNGKYRTSIALLRNISAHAMKNLA